MVREPKLMPFFFFFLYHAFIVFRYKKLRAALAMEKTKPIKQTTNNKRNLKQNPPLRRRAGKPFAKTLQISNNDGILVRNLTKNFSCRKYKKKKITKSKP